MRHWFPAIPDEPTTHVAEIRVILEQSPDEGLRRIEEGEWAVATLWPLWRHALEEAGVDQDQFRQIVIDYRNELRLWVMGERAWAHCVEGLFGRIERRTRSPAVANQPDGDWKGGGSNTGTSE